MDNCNIRIDPDGSSSIDYIVWNSFTNVLTVCYLGGDKCYDYEGVEWSDFIDLGSKAQQRDSWGRGLHSWKKDREDKIVAQKRSKFESAWFALSPEDRKRYASWLRQ